MLSDEVKLYEIEGPQFESGMVDTQECHIQVSSTHNVKTRIMLYSPENLYVMEWNLIGKTNNSLLRRKKFKKKDE
jgi:hypothetical protein